MKLILVLFLSFCFTSLTLNKGSEMSMTQVQEVLLKKINDYRIEKQLKPLSIEEGLVASAKNQCDYLFKIGKLSHNQPENKYKTTRDRIILFSSKRYMSYGENCLKTYANLATVNSNRIEDIAEEMFQLWRTSKPHNENLLNYQFTHTGFGFRTNSETEEIYCVMDFGGN